MEKMVLISLKPNFPPKYVGLVLVKSDKTPTISVCITPKNGESYSLIQSQEKCAIYRSNRINKRFIF